MQEHNPAVWGARGDSQSGGQGAGHDGPHSLWAVRWHRPTGMLLSKSIKKYSVWAWFLFCWNSNVTKFELKDPDRETEQV